jgi:hypothetical protein
VPITRQRNRLRVVTEWLMSGLIWDFFERTIHILWSPILYFKRKNNAEKERYTVIWPGVLKFFHDQRAYFALKRKVARDSK